LIISSVNISTQLLEYEMLSRRFLVGLDLVSRIASSPTYRSTTIADLAKQINMSISFIEGLMKNLKDGGVVVAQRGPGGGYMLQRCVDDLTVWDIAVCFDSSEKILKNKSTTSESVAITKLKNELDEISKYWLQQLPLNKLIKNDSKISAASISIVISKLNKPLVKDKLPKAPNSVFDLYKFSNSLVHE